ncbi:MAG: SIS domain-containing protein [Planctomycetota bacterium]
MDLSALRATVEESIATKQRLLANCMLDVERLCSAAVDCILRGGTVYFCGNGGSSCDAAHAAGELIGWFERKQRPPYAAVALGHEVPSLTAISNDAGFEHVFARQLQALGKPADLLVGFSTSGNSRNVVAAAEVAKRIGMPTAALTGENASQLSALVDVCVRVPSSNTARIQESHLLCVHLLCAAVEDAAAR